MKCIGTKGDVDMGGTKMGLWNAGFEQVVSRSGTEVDR